MRCGSKYWYPIDIIEQVISPLHNPDLLSCQPIKLVDLGVYLPVRGLDLAQKECLLVTIFGCTAQGIDLYKQMQEEHYGRERDAKLRPAGRERQ